jgi:hypothetical protein
MEAACCGGAGMSETDLARSCGLPPRGGELGMPEPNVGRAPVTLLSARDLSCSDQLNALSERAESMSEGVLAGCVLLACVMLVLRAVAAEVEALAVGGVRGFPPEVRLPF